MPERTNVKISGAQFSYNHAVTLTRSGQYMEAEALLQEACASVPNNDTYQIALANIFHLQKQYNKAIALYDLLIKNGRESASVWNNRGVSLFAAGRHQDAMQSFSKALQISPALQQTKIALASSFQALGLYEQAISCCNEVLSINPENAEAHWNKSLLLLLDGNYMEGWEEYEWRWKKEGFTSPLRKFSQPRWHGEPSYGKTILVYAEQGFGDTLQFCRYLPLLEQRGVFVVFECHRQLVTVARTLSPTLHVVPFGETLPDFDFHIPLLTLPSIFETSLDTIPSATPYIKVPHSSAAPKRVESSTSRYNIGICWAGKEYPDPARSCPVEYLQPLANITNIDWYSLQVGWNKELPFKMHDSTRMFQDFGDTAAFMEDLDLIITIDTSVAHLAGALGKPTWVLLPFSPDWRWLKEGDNSAWYPEMKLFRQPLPGKWNIPVNRICNLLKTLQKTEAS